MDNNIIDISMDFENLDNKFNKSSSSNFGGGIELLMNDKKRDLNVSQSDINIDDLNNLENDLNDLSAEERPQPQTSFSSNMFGSSPAQPVRFDDQVPIHLSVDDSADLGKSTANIGDESQTWDGYGKFNNIPINPDARHSNEPKLTKEELLKEKFKYLRKLETLEKKGVELTKKYSMDSNLAEMQGEYEMIMEEKTKTNSIKFQGNMMMALVNGMEFLNNKFDPFDVKIDGWGEQLGENITDYDEVFGELYEKHKNKASLAPELKLLFQLGGSAMMLHMTNSMFKTAMPGVDDILRQNPDLMRNFQSAAVNSMSGSNPGLSGFMNGVMNPEPNFRGQEGPPPPVATQGANSVPPPLHRAGNNLGRQDISMARNSFKDDGISFQEQHNKTGFVDPPLPSQKTTKRPEMKGPSDIDDILSGLKTKTINISDKSKDANSTSIDNLANNNSTISIDELKDLQGTGNVPKRSRRRPKSDKNTVSLDI